MTPDIRTNPHAEAWLDSERATGSGSNAVAQTGMAEPAAASPEGNSASSAPHQPPHLAPDVNAGMLVITRTRDEAVIIRVPGLAVPIRISANDIRNDRVRLGFQAPREVEINREEIDTIKHLTPKSETEAA